VPLVLAAVAVSAPRAEPIRLHRDNPHYFLWRGEPTVLITSGEHYGAVLNGSFNYKKYLRTLESLGFNLTRTFSGAYCEPLGAFNIKNNTLAPAKGHLICPWARSNRPGYANGGNKFDLKKWDAAYFERLRDFVGEAGERGVVVELVMFCPFYKDDMWKLSPMNAANNVNGIGQVARNEVYTLDNPGLLDVQDAMVRRIVRQLNEFDNVYYEICNEPYERSGQSRAWQAHIAETIVKAESGSRAKHLIAQNLPWKRQNVPSDVKDRIEPVRHVSILNFHYAGPPGPIELYYDCGKVVAYDETGFAGSEPKPYRIAGWDFIIAGGAVYDNLDYSFAVGHEDGTARIDAPGGGGPILHKQLGILRDFICSFDFVEMEPDNSVIKGGVPDKATARALVQKGRAYAIYINGGRKADLVMALPEGNYGAEWINTKTGEIDMSRTFYSSGGNLTLSSPPYEDDIALRIVRSE
jgi:hypothetical protein